jgi:pyrimidine-nucleoside phosphorylase
LVGRAAVALGAGREKLEDKVDPAVGIEILAPQGTRVQAGDAVLRVRYRGDARLKDAVRLLDEALRVDEEPPVSRPLILERITHG